MKKSKRFTACLFFFINNRFIIYSANVQNSQNYGDFLVYPKSHFEIWQNKLKQKYRFDFDYYPRERVSYNKVTDTYNVLYDKCIENKMPYFINTYFKSKKVMLILDEHYTCHMCNDHYILQRIPAKQILSLKTKSFIYHLQ